MDRIPSLDERQWLTHALKKVIARRGGNVLDAAPLVEPTNDWFPEKWASTAAHGHRLAQRLMHYAGLGELNVSLNVYQPVRNDGEEAPWDAGTAGWFAGIRGGRAFFGLHVGQFSDPEAAAGVLAHEVAHAWRRHHRLVVDDREKEEPLTDVTTVALGFGILTTNNTDRYRSSGTWSKTAWSMSSVGYLSPQAMSWLLAIWSTARSVPGERRTIERHLEPNQRSYFRASLEEIDRSDSDAGELLRAAGPKSQRTLHAVPAAFVPHEPSADEIDEPEQTAPDPQANRGTTVYQKSRGEVFPTAFMAALAAYFVAWLATLIIDDSSMTRALLAGLIGAILAAGFAGRHARRPACSACSTRLNGNPDFCPGCGGTVGPRVSTRELRRIREEELDRRAALSTGYEDCDACEPEHPCPAHAPTFAFGVPLDEETNASSPPPSLTRITSSPETPVSGRFLRRVGGVIAIAAGITIAFAWWRQNHVPVYFDNPLGSPVSLNVDGARFAIAGRPPVVRTMNPGKHHIVVTESNREIEQADVVIEPQPLPGALTEPRFYVYSVAGRGTYERTQMVYSADKQDRNTTSTLITMQRWIRQEEVDYLFTRPPDTIPGTRSVTREVFAIPDLSPRQVSYALDHEGKHEDAVRALRQGLEPDPCDTAMRQDLVDLLTVQGKKDDAGREATAWVSACGSSLDAHRIYQDVLGRGAGREAILKVYRERLRKDPSAINHYLWGRLLNGEAAIAEFREALRIDPNVPWARIALGRQLLETEQDLDAYNALDEAMRAKKVEGIAVIYFAMAAVGAQKQDEALARLPGANQVDGDSLWTAKWILARSKNDWSAARILLAYRETDPNQVSPEITMLRARLERDAGGPVDSLAEDLEKYAESRFGAAQLRFEEAWETGHLREAAVMNPISLPGIDAPGIDDIYAVEAAMLAHLPDAASRAGALHVRLSKEPELLPLLDAAEGRISKETLMTRIADNTLGMAPHAWFALAVHASLTGTDASALFRKSAARALDREFPYRVALRMAENHSGK